MSFGCLWPVYPRPSSSAVAPRSASYGGPSQAPKDAIQPCARQFHPLAPLSEASPPLTTAIPPRPALPPSDTYPPYRYQQKLQENLMLLAAVADTYSNSAAAAQVGARHLHERG